MKHLILLTGTLLLFSWNCTPSSVVYDRQVYYNFVDEGFLDRNTLQTIGEGAYPPGEIGKEFSDRICIDEALKNARERALSIILHTRFNIQSKKGNAGLVAGFSQDYPRSFSDRDYIHAELAFSEIMNLGFIALQDVREKKKCAVVFRIQGNDLPDQIHNTEVGFDIQ